MPSAILRAQFDTDDGGVESFHPKVLRTWCQTNWDEYLDHCLIQNDEQMVAINSITLHDSRFFKSQKERASE